MPTQILAPTALAATSSDVTIAPGSTNTVAMFQGLAVEIFLLPNGVDAFLLPGGVDNLLLPQQIDNILDKREYASIQLKDPDGTYFDSGMYLRHNALFRTLGPGVWRINKPATYREVGFQSE